MTIRGDRASRLFSSIAAMIEDGGCRIEHVMTTELTPADRFARWRARTRACFWLGVGLCLAAQVPPHSPRRGLGLWALIAGLTLIAATFVLYYRYCNRCPRCGESFSRAPEYESGEMSGLPLFNRIEKCPFCAEPLETDAQGTKSSRRTSAC